eukprot:scaffold10501_cov141-Amphora_coffeaeformis.AAC.3
MSSSPIATTTTAPTSRPTYRGYSFEVTGKVQGVFFRKHTVLQARHLQLMGWVRNTYRGTVEGMFAGENAGEAATALNEMRHWLLHVGSPRSRIEKTTFAPLSAAQIEILRQEYPEFTQRPTTTYSDNETRLGCD